MRRTLLFPLWLRWAVVGLIGLMLAGFGVWRWQLKRDVDRRLASLRAEGIPLSGAELNDFYPAVSDEQNAALVMRQSFALMQEWPNDESVRLDEIRRFSRSDPLDVRDLELISKHVELNSQALDKAAEALLLNHCRYPVDFERGFSTPLPHLAKLKGLSRVAWYQAVLESERGNSAGILSAVLMQFGLAESLAGEPCVLSQLVRVAILRMALSSVQTTLAAGEWDHSQLARLQTALLEMGMTNMLSLAYRGEIAMGLPLFENYERTLRGLMNTGKSDRAREDPVFIAGPIDPLLIRVTGFGQRDLRFYAGAMETNLALARCGPPESLQAIPMRERIERETHQKKYILSAMLLPALAKFNLKHAEMVASIEACKLAIALELFLEEQGSYPAKLHLLVPDYLVSVPIDPFDGQPMCYRKLERGYIIYSVGMDGQDDGGNEPPLRIKSTDTNSYDLTFIVER